MRLTQQLQQQFIETDLEHLRTQGALVAAGPGSRLTCAFADCEKIACEVTQLRLESDGLQELDCVQSKKVADRIVNRLTYLLEPLSIVESDELSRTVQVRSTNPHHLGSERLYYEVLVEPGSLTFGRYCKKSEGDRKTTACSLTREVILRICEDLESATSDMI